MRPCILQSKRIDMTAGSEHDLDVSGPATNQPIGLSLGEFPMPGATRPVFEFSRPLRVLSATDISNAVLARLLR